MGFKKIFDNKLKVSMSFPCFMGIWLGILLISNNYPFLRFENLFSIDRDIPEAILGFLGILFSLIVFAGMAVDNNKIQIIGLSGLVVFFVCLGLMLSYPVLNLGSVFLVTGGACAWLTYRRVLNE